jgi:hypothetical protein
MQNVVLRECHQMLRILLLAPSRELVNERI